MSNYVEFEVFKPRLKRARKLELIRASTFTQVLNFFFCCFSNLLSLLGQKLSKATRIYYIILSPIIGER